jgi:thiosulfate reductase cytochrome b subunit
MKGNVLKVVNPILFIIVLIQILSGLGQRYAGQDAFVFFRRIHLPNGILLVLFFTIHLYLNWGWIKMNFFKPRPEK